MTPAVPGQLPGVAPCVGCGAARHPSVGLRPCTVCGAVRWTLAVAGSRALAARAGDVARAARQLLPSLAGRFGGVRPTLVLHGGAAGVDGILAHHFTNAGWAVDAVRARWDLHGNKAGIIRNLRLLSRADALLVVWDGASPGSRHILTAADDGQVPVAAAVLSRARHHSVLSPAHRAPAPGRAAQQELAL